MSLLQSRIIPHRLKGGMYDFDMSDSDASPPPEDLAHLSNAMQFRVNNIAQCQICDGYLICGECKELYKLKLPMQYGPAQGDTWGGDVCERGPEYENDYGRVIAACPILLCSLCHKQDGYESMVMPPFDTDARSDICAGCMVSVDVYADAYAENAACNICGFAASSSEQSSDDDVSDKCE